MAKNPVDENYTRDSAAMAEKALDAIKEAMDARARFGRMNSLHEGYGVLMEEVRELEQIVFQKQAVRNPGLLEKEARQVAAVALRIAAECCLEEVIRK